MKQPSRNRTLLLSLGLLIAVTMACGGGSSGNDSANLAGTAAALQSTQDALAGASTQASQPAAEVPADNPTEEVVTQDEAFYVEEFTEPPQNWTYYLLSGEEADFDLYTDNDRLVFDISGEYVWPYYLYDSYTYTDVRLDMTAENLGNNNNNISLICRYNDRGWYEFNVANNGLYNIYRYEYDTDNFHELYSGGVQNLKTGKDTNDFTIICEGDRLTLAVNGVEVRTVKDSQYDEGQVGVGVSSFTGTPVLVEVDYVQISQP